MKATERISGEEIQAQEGPLSLRSRSPRQQALEVLCLILAWALLYLPGFGDREFANEEARRALPARAMLESGDYIVPHIFGREYLAKPPGMFWMVVASSKASSLRSPGSLHEIDQAVTRTPALLATLCIALLLWWLGQKGAGRLGLVAATLFLLSPLSFEKGALGEIEAPFGLLVFAASVATLSLHRKGSTLLAGLLFGLATLTKGPPAWVFLGATTLGMALTASRNVGQPPWLGWKRALNRGARILLLSGLLFGAWIVLLVREVPWETLQATWSDEVIGAGFSWLKYLDHRQHFVSGVLAGFLPACLFVIAALWNKASRRELLSNEMMRSGLWTVVIGLAFFLIFPRSRPRYVYPLLPWVALIGARVLCTAFRQVPDIAAARCLRVSGYVIASLGLVGAVAAGLQIAGALSMGFELTPRGMLLVAGILLASLVGLFSAHRLHLRRTLGAGALVIAMLRVLHLTEIAPDYVASYERVSMAAELDRAVPAKETLYTGFWSEFNLLAHSQRRIRYVPAEKLELHSKYVIHPCPAEVPANCEDPVCPHARGRDQWEELFRLRCPKRDYVLSVDRRQGSAPSGSAH